MLKKIIHIGLCLITVLSLFAFSGCARDRSFGEKPKGFDDPMPELWEEILSGKAFDTSSVNKYTTEITIKADVTDINLEMLIEAENLENIYVEEGNQKFVSDDGVLYSKSYQTLYKWPSKKPVTIVKETVKYFAPMCFYKCDMPEGFEIPDGTISIGGNAFRESNLSKLHIKQNVKSVGYRKYSKAIEYTQAAHIFPVSCKLVEISAPIVYSSFYDMYYYIENGYGMMIRGIETIIFNEGVRQIRANGNDSDRERNVHTKYVEFPNTLEAIGDVHFSVNVKVTKYILPAGIVYLGEYAFDDYYIKQEENPILKAIKRLFSIGEAPSKMLRHVNTEFSCLNQISKDYIESNSSEWEKNKSKIHYYGGFGDKYYDENEN